MNFIKNFYKNFICVRLSDYEGFNSDLEISKLLFFVFLGVCVACMIITYQNSSATLILKKLTRIGAFGEEKSKTLADIGLEGSMMVKILLMNKSGALKSIILTKGTKKLSFEEYTELQKAKRELKGLSKEEKKKKLSEINEKLSPTLDFANASFYIPADQKDAAERFIADKSTTMAQGLTYCGILIAVYLLIALSMPTILSWISNIIT